MLPGPVCWGPLQSAGGHHVVHSFLLETGYELEGLTQLIVMRIDVNFLLQLCVCVRVTFHLAILHGQRCLCMVGASPADRQTETCRVWFLSCLHCLQNLVQHKQVMVQ